MSNYSHVFPRGKRCRLLARYSDHRWGIILKLASAFIRPFNQGRNWRLHYCEWGYGEWGYGECGYGEWGTFIIHVWTHGVPTSSSYCNNYASSHCQLLAIILRSVCTNQLQHVGMKNLSIFLSTLCSLVPLKWTQMSDISETKKWGT